jgi:hypothetical protein
MGKHTKILDSWKGFGTGLKTHMPIYHVIKSSKYGTFHGSVSPCPQDIENINDWDGYHFAERKCDIQIVHAKAKILRERAQGILNVINILTAKYEEKHDGDGLDYLMDVWRQYDVAKKEYEKVYSQYIYMRDSFSDYTTRMIERRKKLNEKVEKMREQL